MPGLADVEADPKTWFAIVAIEFAAFRGALVRLTADEPVADSTDVAIPWDAAIYDTDGFWEAGNPTRLMVPAGVTKIRLKANIDWSFGGTGHRHVWIHQNGSVFFGMGRESDESAAGVQNIGSAVVDVSTGDYSPGSPSRRWSKCSSARSAPPEMTLWSPAGAPIPSACIGRRWIRSSSSGVSTQPAVPTAARVLPRRESSHSR